MYLKSAAAGFPSNSASCVKSSQSSTSWNAMPIFFPKEKAESTRKWSSGSRELRGYRQVP